MIQSLDASLDVDAKIYELIDGDIKWWKKSLIHNMFSSQ